MTHQDKSAVRGLISELLGASDGHEPNDARADRGDAMRRLLQAGLQDLIEAEASVVWVTGGAITVGEARRRGCG